MDLAYLKKTFPNGTEITLKKGDFISRVHQKIEFIHWLIDGTVKFSMSLNEKFPEVEVCQYANSIFPIGWNGVQTPNRNTKNIIVCSKEAFIYRVPLEGNQAFLNTFKDIDLHKHVCRIQFELLKEAVYKQKQVLPKQRLAPYQYHTSPITQEEPKQDELIQLFKRSPFFEPFDDGTLALLSSIALKRSYETTDIIVQQDTPAEGLFLLKDGRVTVQRYGERYPYSQWPITHPGLIIGWARGIQEMEFCTARAAQPTTCYLIPWDFLEELLERDTEFALQFYIRLNWLVDNHISAAFVRYLSFHFNFDELTIRYLIEQNQTQIHVASELHLIPHLLKNRSTKKLVFPILDKLVVDGSSKERRLASMCLDLLKDTKRESDFLVQLEKVYTTVTDSPENLDITTIRTTWVAEAQKLDTFFDFEIEGQQQLPDHSGHIILHNHLLTDSYYTLNNNFQIALDSHFIAAEMLQRKYGDPGTHVVRIGRSQDFAHQNYYGRLRHINVRSTEPHTKTTTGKKTVWCDAFLNQAAAILAAGENLVIPAEETGYSTEDHIPGPFQSSIFQLALRSDPEPFIVPVMLLNFDKKIGEATRYCKILPAFQVSKHPLFDPKHPEKFAEDYHAIFKSELDRLKTQLMDKKRKPLQE